MKIIKTIEVSAPLVISIGITERSSYKAGARSQKLSTKRKKEKNQKKERKSFALVFYCTVARARSRERTHQRPR